MSTDDRPIPPPPVHFHRDHALVTLKVGTLLHRVYSRSYAIDQYNDSGAEFRFSPIRSAGTVIPVWYAGLSMKCAFYETVVHDAAYKGTDRTVAWPYLLNRRYGQMCCLEPLTLVSLKSSALSGYDLTLDDLIATPPRTYEKTARWAEAIYHAFPAAHGLVWNSYRADDGQDAIMLFGNKRTEHLISRTRIVDLGLTTARRCVRLLNTCLDETHLDILGHPAATPTAPVHRAPLP